jgi:hypothetical protein
MPFAMVRTATLLALAGLVLTPLRPIHAADRTRDAASPPLFGHHKQQTCGQKSRERVKAVMDGVPLVRSGKTPAATNLDCR